MTIDTNELRALCNAATPYKRVEPTEGTVLQFVGVYVTRWQPEWGEPTVGFVGDDELQAAAREAVPQLLDECERLRAALLEHAKSRYGVSRVMSVETFCIEDKLFAEWENTQ